MPSTSRSSLRRSRLLIVSGVAMLGVAASAQARSDSQSHHRRHPHPIVRRRPATSTPTTTTTGPGHSPPHGAARPERVIGRGARLILAPRHTVAVKAHAAAGTSVTISDFQFTPATITIHVGDTVTWTNNGPSAHTATANDGSFNTGVLQKGQSGSHTFTTAGTFAYHCAIHTFMHGTVVVLAASSGSTTPSSGSSGSGKSSNGPSGSGGSSGSGSPSSGSGSGSGGSGNGTGSSGGTSGDSTPGSTSSSAGDNQPTLPVTGFTVGALVAAGFLLLGAGLALRRAQAR
jgi:plastocyanin